MLEDLKTRGRNLRCYISAPIGTNIENVRDSLLEKNVQLLMPRNLSIGQDIYEGIKELISQADLVVGVLNRERRSHAVLFELGMAAALDKQIVVFAPPKGAQIPFNLQSFLVLRIGLRNKEAIDFALNQLLLAPASKKKSIRGDLALQRKPRSSIATQIVELQNVMEVGDGRRFEEIITEVIRDSGVEVAVRPTFQHREMDLAVWAEDFQNALGNPLLIEIKWRLENDEQMRAALKRCAASTAKSGGRWSLFIYGAGPKLSRKHWSSIAPTVLAIPALDLFEQMRDRSFVQVLVGLRNLRVHGGEF